MAKSREEIVNEEQFMKMLAYLRSDLWAIEVYRQSLGYGDLEWLKDVMRSVFNIVSGSGTGETIIEIRGKKLIRIRGSETVHLERDLL